MLFNSYIFVLFFLPFCIIGYFSLNHLGRNKLSQVFLLAMSCWFYGYFNCQYLILIISSISVNYFLYKLLNYKRNIRVWIITIAILFNLVILFYFKYYNFFLENVNFIFREEYSLKAILLPLGISFFTFQQISFIIDAYRGEIPNYNLLDYACFVTYFPQLIAGPIVTHDELVPGICRKCNHS